MTVKEAATKWGLSERRLQTICNEGMIPGVIKFGRSWAIPVNAQKPVDKRIKSGNKEANRAAAKKKRQPH